MNKRLKECNDRLIKAIDDNNKKDGNIWFVKYVWWNFYNILNEEFTLASTAREKEALIEYAKALNSEVINIVDHVAETHNVSKDEVAKLNPEDFYTPPHIKEVSEALTREVEKFTKQVREFNREKKGKKAPSKDRRVKRSKWISS